LRFFFLFPGGAALSVLAISGAPIKFTGVGEKVEALEPFYPDRMASRILGMGDVVTMVEKAQKVRERERARARARERERERSRERERERERARARASERASERDN